MDASVRPRRLLTVPGLDLLLRTLAHDGYQVIGPSVRDGAIVHAEIRGVADLPAGWTEVQEAGTYRLIRRADAALFGYALGPQSWKPRFFVPRLRLFRARREHGTMTIEPEPVAPPRVALVGARSCDLHAIGIQDRT
ncbi:MAG: sulfite reductase subunit A, partial [Acidobacteriota bacterium]|nr:sulfite reductase subunit A [Acidobacteriota bacterium]